MLFLCAEHGDRRFYSFVITGGIMCCSIRLRCRHLTAGLSEGRYFVSRLGSLWQYRCWCLILSVLFFVFFLHGLVLHTRASKQSHIWVGQWPVGYSVPGRCLNHYWPIVSKKVSIIVWYCNHIMLSILDLLKCVFHISWSFHVWKLIYICFCILMPFLLHRPRNWSVTTRPTKSSSRLDWNYTYIVRSLEKKMKPM